MSLESTTTIHLVEIFQWCGQWGGFSVECSSFILLKRFFMFALVCFTFYIFVQSFICFGLYLFMLAIRNLVNHIRLNKRQFASFRLKMI